jgi:hypothetical protein
MSTITDGVFLVSEMGRQSRVWWGHKFLSGVKFEFFGQISSEEFFEFSVFSFQCVRNGLRESLWPIEEKQKNIKRINTRALGQKFNNSEEKANWISKETEEANQKTNDFNPRWFPVGWLSFVYLGYPSGLNRDDCTCFNPPQKEETDTEMRKAYEELWKTGHSVLYFFLLIFVNLKGVRYCTDNYVEYQEIKLLEESLETPISADGDEKSTSSRRRAHPTGNHLGLKSFVF